MQSATVPKATNSALRSIYPVSSPAFFWRSLCGCRSHCGRRGCEKLKRANTGVVYAFPISSAVGMVWFASFRNQVSALCMGGLGYFLKQIYFITLSLLLRVWVCMCIYIFKYLGQQKQGQLLMSFSPCSRCVNIIKAVIILKHSWKNLKPTQNSNLFLSFEIQMLGLIHYEQLDRMF